MENEFEIINRNSLKKSLKLSQKVVEIIDLVAVKDKTIILYCNPYLIDIVRKELDKNKIGYVSGTKTIQIKTDFIILKNLKWKQRNI